MAQVSVIMPVYNASAYVLEAARSVLNQSWHDLELIVVDDGSSDGSPDLLEALARDDPRLRLLRGAHSGCPGGVRNLGLERARGDYLAFLDADDWYDHSRVEACMAAMASAPDLGVLFHDVALWGGPGATPSLLGSKGFLSPGELRQSEGGVIRLGADFHARAALLGYSPLHTSSVFLRRAAMPWPVRFAEDLTVGEDVDLWLRLARAAPTGCLPVVLSHYRCHGRGLSSRRERALRDRITLHERNYRRGLRGFGSAGGRRYRCNISRLHANLAYDLLLEARNGEARTCYRRSLKWAPSGVALAGWLKSWVPWARLRRSVVAGDDASKTAAKPSDGEAAGNTAPPGRELS